MALNPKTGRETPDQTPIAVPVGFSQAESLQQMIARAVRSAAFMEAARRSNVESFEEADDFDVDDDNELKSPYEVDESLPTWRDQEQRQEAAKKAYNRFPRKQKPSPAPPAPEGPDGPGPDPKPAAK